MNFRYLCSKGFESNGSEPAYQGSLFIELLGIYDSRWGFY